MENTWKNFRLFFEKFPTTAAPPLCEQSQPGHDEIIDRSSTAASPPLCQQSQPGHDEIIDRSSTAASPPLCQQSQPGHDEIIDRSSTTASPPLCQQRQPGHDKIIDRSFSPVLQLVDFKSTHKSLLERTTPSMRYRSPNFRRVNPLSIILF
jgi:hypothetical protein